MTELEKQTFDKANALIEKNKQIEEMEKLICLSYGEGVCRKCDDYDFCTVWQEAERLYNAGYRKASDVTREIFEEIEKEICSTVEVILTIKDDEEDGWYDGQLNILGILGKYCAELKKEIHGGRDMTRNELYELESDIVVKTIERIKQEQAEYIKGVEYGMDLAFRAVGAKINKEEEEAIKKAKEKRDCNNCKNQNSEYCKRCVTSYNSPTPSHWELNKSEDTK